jgi:hypothetical protein
MISELRISPHVRFLQIDELLVFLDLRTGTYHAMGSVAACMWDGIRRLEERSAIVQSLSDRYLVDPERLERDLDGFLQQLVSLGFLETPQANDDSKPLMCAPPPSVKRPLALRAWCCLWATVRSLRTRGFGDTYCAYSHLQVATEGIGKESALTAFSRAENFFHIRTAPRDCLPRSLALFRFLRSVGIPAEHCIGVRRFPFMAHAWVECEGEVIHDNPSLRNGFTALARISA